MECFSPLATEIYAGAWHRSRDWVWRRAGARMPAMWPGSRIFGRALIAPARPGELALTFGRRAQPGEDAAFARRPRGHGVRVTFFMVAGTRRPNRSWCGASRRQATWLGTTPGAIPTLRSPHLAACREELVRTKETLEQITGQPVRYFRPPFGARPARCTEHGTPAGNDARAVERNHIRLERALGGPDCETIDAEDRPEPPRGWATNIVMPRRQPPGTGREPRAVCNRSRPN